MIRGFPMKGIFAAAAGVLLAGATVTAVHAELSAEAARAAITPFYKSLNAEFTKESADLIRQAAAPDWTSCGANDVCNSRDEVIAGIAARLKSVPDLKWQIKDILVSGNQVMVRGEATGTPSGEFFGTPHTGKSFKIMSIDVHTIEGGKMVRSYHIENWMGAVRQLSAN
jgi:predicted ester cyclase